MSLYRSVGILFFVLFFAGFHADAQEAPVDSMLYGDSLSEVVVTATRSDRKLADVPIPVTIIGQEQIQSSGASRLDEILSEQTGLAIINNHGFGVQMQGMDPEYCLILINGEPVIGRTAGTLDLTRITLNNVQRIEIIKGPSSSLYGSDALAGVINIITKDTKRTGVFLKSQYGSHQTTDNTLTGSLALGQKGAAFLSLNRFHTNGYDLMSDTYGKTVDPYTDYTLHGKIRYQFTPKLNIELNARYFSEEQRNNYLATSGDDSVIVKGKGKVEDKYINPVISYRISPKWKLKLRNYWSQYKTESDLYDSKTDTGYEHTYFRQEIWKEELQSEYIINPYQILTIGAGFNRQMVKATRYPAKEVLWDYFIYGQHEWHPTAKWNILAGMRYDHPSEYHSQFSPKLAAQYKWNDHWSFRASVGMGYKAPDFRQLYLTFSNPIVGYSVLGTKAVEQVLSKMQAEGQIERVYIQPGDMTSELKPESSIAYNLGGSYTGSGNWEVGVNLFRNDIKDLIDTRTIAMKTNGQPLYSYYNVHRVFTEGVEMNGSIRLLNNSLVFRAGYQFLIAKDKQVVEEIRDGKRFKRDPETLETKKLSMSEYGGLFNRSRHSFNVKMNYTYHSWSFNTRLVYRGRFGFADMNGDNILDAENEYAPGYALCHLNMERSFANDKIKVQAGIKNLFDYTDPKHLAYEPGRTWYVSASVHLYKTKNK